MKRWFHILGMAVLLFACQSTDVTKIEIDPGFTDYVNAFTSGVISSQSTIKVVLAEPVANAKKGDPLNADIFTFEPSIEGHAKWADAQTIEFIPEKTLPSGQSYLAQFKLKNIKTVPENFEVLKFGFIVIRQNIIVKITGVKTNNDKDYSLQTIFGTVRTNDPIAIDALANCFEAKQNGKAVKIDWSQANNSKSYQFSIRDVARSKSKSNLTLSWNAEKIGADIEDEIEYEITPLNEFKLLNIETNRENGLYISLQFSDPIDRLQNLDGLVTLNSGKSLKLTIDGNEIKAYPLSKFSGDETINIFKGIKNTLGKAFENNEQHLLVFNMAKPALELVGDGVIIPSTGALNFPFKAINLKAVNLRVLQIFDNNIPQFLQANQLNGSSDLKRVGRIIYDGVVDLVSEDAIDYGVWNSFSLDLNQYIKSEPGAIYRIMMSFEQYQSLYPCADSGEVVKPMEKRDISFDDGRDYFDDENWFEGWYEYEDRDDPCTPSYYQYWGRSISANLIASNFGIICKSNGQQNYNCIVTDLRNANAIRGVEVEAYNYQNQLIGTGKTNDDGVASIQTKGKPYLIIARDGQQKGYLRVDEGSALSLSLYEVNGQQIKDGIKGFIYGERGVWRPGDTLFLSFILEDPEQKIPESYPVVIEFYNPLGQLYSKKVNTKGISGVYSFKMHTPSDAPTGNWNAKIKVGNAVFNKTLKVETVKPNRLKMKFDFGELIQANRPIETDLKADWLYGAPASNLKIVSEMTVEKTKTSFKGFENYQFDDYSKSFYFDEPIEVESQTNAEGKAHLYFPYSRPQDAPGMLKLKFNTKVFEQGGEYSQDFYSVKCSPYLTYAGMKIDQGQNWLNAVDTDKPLAIALASVDQVGKGLSKELKIELYKMNWNYWWESDYESDYSRYINRSSAELLQTEYVNVQNGKTNYNLKFAQQGWGRYLLRVVDPSSNHSAAIEFYGSYSSWYDDAGQNADAATALSIETEKESYQVGEKIGLKIPSGGQGKIYISIEKGDKILKQMWIDAAAGNTHIEIDATKEMSPNIYVSAFLIQPHGQTENSMPIRMYGVIPVSVNDENTKLYPQIRSADVWQPEKTFKVNVSEKTGKPMAYTLAVVDEGLLSLTRFKTPNPCPWFYAKEALGVRSWDMYKYVLNADIGKMTPLLAIGGDEGLVYKEDAEVNRFQSVVSYLGPFYLDANEKAEHQIKVPNYVGELRIMVVAAKDKAYGSVDKSVTVKQNLMVLSTLPRVLGPSEQVKIPVNVIVMDERLKQVTVTIKTNDMLKAKSSLSQTVNFSKPGEQTIFFDFETARKLGKATFEVNVKSGKEKANEKVELEVRAPNPEIAKAESKLLVSNESWTSEINPVGIKGSNRYTIEISTLPDLNLDENLEYLIQYPHGCIEQTVSSVFPQIFLEELVELNPAQKQNIQKNVTAAIEKLRQFQLSDGSFSYWPGRNYPSLWGTNYAGHFLIEAKNRSYKVPEEMFENWLKYQKKSANRWQRSSYNEWGEFGSDLEQSYRLYTLALAGNADMSAMNRLRKDPLLSSVGAWRLSTSYAISGKKDIADELAKTSIDYSDRSMYRYTYGSDLRNMAMNLESMAYLGQIDRGMELLKDIAARLSKGWHSTQTRAYSLIAISKFINKANFVGEISANLKYSGKSVNIQTKQSIWRIEIEEANLEQLSFELKNLNAQNLYAKVYAYGIPVEYNLADEQQNLNMFIKYYNLQGERLDITQLKQGTDFKAVVSVSHPGIRDQYSNIALSQIFPSGWQIVNTRVGDEDSGNSNFDYQDIRDDRVYTYFNLNKSETKTFEILLNASYIGKYYQPAVSCSAMYDETIKAIVPGQWVEVLK
ncbi:MAG: hypothetical protein JXR60_04835 [Bacteroidales bacterium]|nr:hypothetical protein [Bacteroidales bacterium]